MAGVHAECGTVLLWPYNLHESILLDMQAKRPHALLLLAYVGVLFGSLEKSFWYIRGWAKSIIDEVDTLLAGQPRFLELLEWPKRNAAGFHGY